MKKIVFDFIATMPLKEVDKSASTVVNSKTPVAGADFRLLSDGSIYPSLERIKKDELEFQPENSGLPEFGYDVFLSTDWGQFTGNQVFPCITKVSKHLPKVSLFARAKYKNGIPKNNILDIKTAQGSELIKLLETSYCETGETLFQNRTYVDLKIEEATPMLQTPNKIYNLPKKVEKGASAGKPTFIRRENIIIYPISIVDAGSVADVPKATPKKVQLEGVLNTTSINNTAVPADLAEMMFGK